jgi:uncharacterized membrane protein YccC
MSYVRSYKRIGRLIQNETYEPMLSWGVRMALSGTVPLIWGLATGKTNDAIWITLTAEAVCWVELKGSFAWRMRTLVGGALLAVLAAAAGALSGSSIVASALLMFAVAFVSSLLKNMGDRASGLAICLYLLFILSNAYPETEYRAIIHRLALVSEGAGCTILVSVLISVFMPAEQPYRRQVAVIWRALSQLAGTIGEKWDHAVAPDHFRSVYLKEQQVRLAINTSLQFYDVLVENKENAEQARTGNKQHYELAQLRKLASMITVNTLAINEEADNISLDHLDATLRVKMASLVNALCDATHRLSTYILTLREDERMLAETQATRMARLLRIVKLYPLPHDPAEREAIKRILHVYERTVKLMENALKRITSINKDAPVYRSYSLLRMLYTLNPRYLLNGVKYIFNPQTLLSQYALRAAIATTLALLVYQVFHINHGYWLPFSVMIVKQPYISATYKRALQRVAGTITGGLLGSLLLSLPTGLHVKEVMLFITFIFMVYYLRKNYGIAAFFITLNLVLLFNLEKAYNTELLIPVSSAQWAAQASPCFRA